MADFPVTLSDDRISPLSVQEKANIGFSHKFSIPYTDLTATGATGSSDTVTFTLGSTATKWFVEKAMANVSTAFAGTTALTVVVGTTTNTSAFLTSTSVLTAGIIGAAGFDPATVTNCSGTTSVGLRAVFTNATGGSPSALTAGNLNIYLNLQDAAQLP